MLAFLLALLFAAPTSDDPQATLVVVFKTDVTVYEADRLLDDLGPDARRLSRTFEPAILGGALDGPLDPARMDALFEAGAIHVKVTRSAAHLMSMGYPSGVSVDSLEAQLETSFGRTPRYNLQVEVPAHWKPSRGREMFADVMGYVPSRTKTANEARITVPETQAEAIRARLAGLAEVVSVREE